MDVNNSIFGCKHGAQIRIKFRLEADKEQSAKLGDNLWTDLTLHCTITIRFSHPYIILHTLYQTVLQVPITSTHQLMAGSLITPSISIRGSLELQIDINSCFCWWERTRVDRENQCRFGEHMYFAQIAWTWILTDDHLGNIEFGDWCLFGGEFWSLILTMPSDFLHQQFCLLSYDIIIIWNHYFGFSDE